MKNYLVTYTSISDLIAELKALADKYGGDLPVCFKGASPIHLDMRPGFYDGGYFLRDSQDHLNYLHSRQYPNTVAFPNCCIDILGSSPDDYEDYKLNGRSVREIDPDSWEYLEKIQQEEKNLFHGQLVLYEFSQTLDKELGCYPVKAYLNSGDFGIGKCMKDAKEELIINYLKAHQ